MVYNINKFIICFMSFLLLNSCTTTTKFDMGKSFEERLQESRGNIPTANQFKEAALSNNYPYTTYDEMWNSIIKVLMQNGLIVHLSKESGTIVAMLNLFPAGLEQEYLPLSNTVYLFIEKGNEATVVFLKANYPIYKVFFDELSMQIYAGKKWKYLYKESPK